MKSLIPDWLPKLFVKAEGSVREATTKKFSDFNKITDTEGMEVVGIKNGSNVRADFVVPDGNAQPEEITTSMVGLEPDDPLRNTRGQFMPTRDLPELENQKDANRFIASELQRLDQEIEGIEGGGGDVDLSGYATIEYVDQTEIEVLNAALKVTTEGDAALQAQIDNLQEPDLDGYATEQYVDDSIAAIEFPEGTDLSGYAKEEWVTEQIEAIPPTDLDGYATEAYVDEAILNIDFPDPDLDGYATTEYVDQATEDLEAQIPSLDGYATEIYVSNEINKIEHPEYNDSGIKQDLADETAARIAGDNTLQAEITELALAVDTLLVQQESGKWKYIGAMGDAIPRNPGEFVLATDDLSSDNNIVQVNTTDLDNEVHGFSDLKAGDYIEIVDADRPDDFVLFTCAGEAAGTGIVDIPVNLKKKGNNFLVNEVCDIRVFSINEQDLDISELDERYALKSEIPDTEDLATVEYSDEEDAKLLNRIEEIEDSLSETEPDPEEFDDLPWSSSNRAFMRYAVANSSLAKGFFIVRTKDVTHLTGSSPEQLEQAREDQGPLNVQDIVCLEFPKSTKTAEDLSLGGDYDWSENPPEYGSWMTVQYEVRYDTSSGSAPSVISTHLRIGNYLGYNEDNETYKFECLGIEGEKCLICDYYGEINWRDNKGVPLFFLNSTYTPSLYVEKDDWSEANANIYKAIEKGDKDNNDYTDLKIAEAKLDSILPDKELTYAFPYYYFTGGYNNPGKLTSKPSYRDPIEEWTEVYLNVRQGDGADVKEELMTVKDGDYLELIHDNENWALFKVTRDARTYSSYVYYSVEHVASAGEFTYDNNALNDDTQVQVKLWESSGAGDTPLTSRELDYGYYHYEMAPDGVTVNNLADNPGTFICIDADDNTHRSMFNPQPVSILFAPTDKNGKRPPATTGTNDYQTKKFAFWNLFTVGNERNSEVGERTPAWGYDAKSFDKPFYYCSRRDSSNRQLAMIKMPEGGDYNYNYIAMEEDLHWKWPI